MLFEKKLNCDIENMFDGPQTPCSQLLEMGMGGGAGLLFANGHI